MVMARDRFLGGGHYQPIADALSALAGRTVPDLPGLVLDLAGGTGYYLARVLDAAGAASAPASTCPRPRCAGPPGPIPARRRSARTPGSGCRSPTAPRRWC